MFAEKQVEVDICGPNFKAVCATLKEHIDKRTHLSSLASLEKNEYLRSVLEKLLEIVTVISDLPPENQRYYINEGLPLVLKSLMNQQVNAFLCAWMSARIRFLKLSEPVEGDALMLRRIFSPRKRYYDCGELAAFERDIEMHFARENSTLGILLQSPAAESESDKVWITAAYNKQILPAQSRTFIFNVICFAKLGGFQICKELFQQDLKPTAIVPLCRIMKALSNMMECLTKEQWQAALVPIALAAVKSGRSLIEQWDMKPGRQKYVRKFVMCIKKILESPYDQTRNLVSAATTLQMDLTAKLVSATSLELRIGGILEIIGIVGKLRSKWPEDNKLDEAAGPTPDELAAKEVAEALKRGKILDCVLAETDHRKEILVPCYKDDLFGFMYAWKALGEEEIGKMYKLATTPEEDADNYFIQAFESLIVHFSVEHARQTFDYVKSVPLLSFTDRTVRVLSALGKNECLRCCKAARGIRSPVAVQQAGEASSTSAPSKEGALRLKGGNPLFQGNKGAGRTESDPYVPGAGEAEPSLGILQYIFSLTHSAALEKGLSRELQKTVIQDFVNLVSIYCHKFKKDMRAEYLILCEDMLSQDQSSLQISEIYFNLTRLLTSEGTKLPITVPELFQKMVMQLLHLKLGAVQKALDKIAPSERAQLQSRFYEDIGYFRELGQRLDIFSQLIHLGKHTIRPESVKILCEAFVVKNVSVREKDAIFEFMRRVLEDKTSESLVRDKVFDSFIYEILLRLHPRAFTDSAFACFRQFFFLVNSEHKQLKNADGALQVLGDKLIALQGLWDIAMQSETRSVSSAASELLLDLYKHADAKLLARVGKRIKGEYVKECMRYIRSANAAHSETASRALDLLLSCLNAFEGHEQKSGGAEGTAIHIRKHFNAGMSCTGFGLDYQNHTMRSLIRLLEPGYSVGDVSLITKFGVMRESELPVSDFGIDCDTDIISSRREDVAMYTTSPTSVGVEGGEPPAIQALRNYFSGLSEQVYAIALVRANGALDVALTSFNDEKTILDIKAEAQKLTEQKLRKLHSRAGGKISEVIAESEEYCGILDASLNIPGVSSKAWELINKLPLEDKKMRELVIGIMHNGKEKSFWGKMLPIDNLNTMAVTLKNLANIVSAAPFEDTTKGRGAAVPGTIKSLDWATAFIEFGGFEYLMELLPVLFGKEVLLRAPMSEQGQNMAVHCIGIITAVLKTLSLHALLRDEKGAVMNYIGPDGSKAGDENNKSTWKSMGKIPLRVEVGDSSVKFIVQILKGKQMGATLVQLIQGLSAPEVLKNYSLRVIDEAVTFLGALLCSDPGYCQQLYEGEVFADYLANVLKSSDSMELRTILVESLKKVLKASEILTFPADIQRPEVYLFNYLVTYVPPATESLPNSEHYFALLSELLPIYKRLMCGATEMAETMLRCVLDRLSVAEVTRNDRQLSGYMSLLLRLIGMDLEAMGEFHGKDVGLELGTICDEIYGSGSPYKRGTTMIQVRKCIYKPMMQTALSVIHKLATHNKEARLTVLNRMAGFHREQLKGSVKETGYEGSLLEDGSRRYVGLKNFGATCYANAMLQQLFMMPQFRSEILAIPAEKIPIADCDKVILNLNKMFAYMLLSDQQYYLPEELFSTLQWFKEGPISRLVQRDAEEFFNLLTEKLEGELDKVGKKTRLADLMKIVLSGQHESLEPDFQYTSGEIEESDLKLHLNVKGKKSIEEALDAFVKGDILEGENKWSCVVNGVERKIRANKQQVIKSLSDVLIIHLNRFEYNSTTGERPKLNNKFSFPMVINMLKWTKDNPCEPEKVVENLDAYNYELVGVVVHCGYGAEGGHYISLIKERDPTSPNEGKWFEFDDDIVRPYNKADMPADCFGKEQDNYYQYEDISTVGSWRQNGPTAYLLVYQRIVPKARIQGTIVPEQLKSSIEQDNLLHANTKIYYDAQYAEFVRDFFRLWPVSDVPPFKPEDSVSEEDDDPALQAAQNPYLGMCKLAFRYAVDLVSRGKDFKRFKDFSTILANHLRENAGLSVWAIKFMIKQKTTVLELLIDQRFEEGRKEIVDLISVAVSSSISCDAKSFGSREVCDPSQPASYRCAALRFLHLLVTDGLEFAKKNWRKHAGFFKLLQNFSEQSTSIAETFIGMGLVSSLFRFLSPSALSTTVAGEKNRTEEFLSKSKGPVSLLSVLLRHCASSGMKKTKCGPEGTILVSPSVPEIPEEDLKNFADSDFVQLAPANLAELDRLSTVLRFVSWGEEIRSNNVVAKVASSIIAGKSSEKYKIGLELLKDLVKMKDGLGANRFYNAFLGTEAATFRVFLEAVRVWRNEFPMFALDVLNTVAVLAGEEGVRATLKERCGIYLEWVPEYLEEIKDGVPVQQNFLMAIVTSLLSRPSFSLLNDASVKDRRERVASVLANGLGLVRSRTHATVEELKDEVETKGLVEEEKRGVPMDIEGERVRKGKMMKDVEKNVTVPEPTKSEEKKERKKEGSTKAESKMEP